MMALPVEQQALTVFHRFGFGPRPGDLAALIDPRGALHAEVADPDGAMVGFDTVTAYGLTGTAASTEMTYQGSDARRAIAVARATAAEALAHPAGRSEAAAGGADARIAALAVSAGTDARILRGEAMARFRKAATARIGFVERLVAFWSNHFCVSIARGEFARATGGSFEREAIRPHVLGRFADMLAAVERHPAMLTYLDNAQSIGPDSRGNINRKRGLNENLAREILELHTVGVDGGYTQGDVTTFARVLTGWTVAGRDGRLGEPGSFVFDANTHQPGDQAMLGRSYVQAGFGQGEAVLADLARHPGTARHVATKLVRHFLSDVPPPRAIDQIAAAFLRSDGNLRTVSLALIDLPEAWATPSTKMRNPYDFLVAVDRLLDRPMSEPWSTIGALKQLGMPLWEPAGPNGFPDTAQAWASPESLKLRLDVSAQVAHGAAADQDPMALLDDAFGHAVSDATRMVVSRAESKEQAVALILMAPEFQRR